MPVSGAHDLVLVVLSVFVAAFASYTALDTAGRIKAPDGRLRKEWLAAAAIVMGGGIWAMHFVGMLAFQLPVQVSFDIGLTLVSLILPVVVTGVGFFVMSRRRAGWATLAASGLLMGLGIAAMHYTGMAAMHMTADLHYSALGVGLSILIAIGASIAALWLAFRKASRFEKVMAASLMGIAIAGMHYTAMHATAFTAAAGTDQATGQASLGQTNLALMVTLMTCLILGLALTVASHDRRERAIAEGQTPIGPMVRTPHYSTLLIAASVLVPALAFALAAWQNWRHLEVVAEDRSRKQVSLIAEHALKVFENNEQVLRRADERLGSVPPGEIRTSFDINVYLNRIVEDLDHLEGIGYVGPDGRLVAVSQSFPAPAIDLSSRDYVANAQAQGRRSFVSAPVSGTISGRSFFRLSRARLTSDGQPNGVLFASMDPAYFLRFYRSVAEAGDSVTMIRRDGAVLMRDPPVTTGVQVMTPQSGLLSGIARAERGTYRTTSELDQVTRIHAYERVGTYPVFVSYGLSLAAIEREWRANILSFGVIAALAALALSMLSLFALRRANQEHRIFLRWQEETARRETAEEALRQAQKMEAVGQLTGGIAHDFNNLLTVVVGNLEFAGRALEKTNIPKAHRNIEAALQGAQRAAALTHRLLAFSRRQPLQPQVVNLNKLVAGMSDLFRRTLGESIQVETVLAGGLWMTSADPNQLESALLNLVINARDAMPEGGRLTIETANCHLDDAYAAQNAEVDPGQYVLVAVTDTGTGMPPEVAAHVFEPFFTTKEIGQGTGLGLSMIYGFVKQSGGHVKIYSEPGQGTSVKLYMPRTLAAEEAPRVPVPDSALRSRAQETILVVEDDADVRAYSIETLTSLGYRVIEARDADTALAALEGHPKVDLLFTDVGLPGRNGRQLADEIRRRLPHLPILFTTGYARNAIIHNGVLDSGLHLLPKPFTVEQLAAKVRGVLEQQAEVV
ncbi:MAG TPA: MHYT domain-containing protein [Microvirga sp.]|jgi:NO-binding membrane sensor protein with MHYT domain/signal transduction histidine kinase/CheY-like chemotaxis protein